MEKTIEIHENSHVLRDLEMLISSQGKYIHNSEDETSHAHFQDG